MGGPYLLLAGPLFKKCEAPNIWIAEIDNADDVTNDVELTGVEVSKL